VTIDGLSKWLQATPFEPFVMHLTNGQEVRVRHPELVARSETGRAIIVYTKGDAFEMIDPLHVASIDGKNGKRKPENGGWATAKAK
jgi:hypothetical protein